MFDFLKLRAHKAGLPPGSVVYAGKESDHIIEVRLLDYDQEHSSESSGIDPEKIEKLLISTSTTWLNIDGLHDVSMVERVGNLIGLHPLTIEDIVNATQRLKIDILDNYTYIVIKIPFYNDKLNVLEMEQVSFVLKEHLLVSFQEKKGDIFAGVLKRISSSKSRIRKMINHHHSASRKQLLITRRAYTSNLMVR